MLEKYITYVNSVILVVLLLGSFGLFGHVSHLLGASSCTGSVTCLYDLNVDSTNGVGTATYQINGLTALASSSGGIAATVTTVNATTSITDAGTLTVTGTSTVGTSVIGGGSTINKFACVTTALNFPSLAGTTTTNLIANTTDTAVSGAVVGDICQVSLGIATTSPITVGCSFTQANTSTVSVINNTSATAIDLPSQNFKICYTH